MAKKINCKDGLTSKEEIKARRISRGLKERNPKVLEEFKECLLYMNDIINCDAKTLNMYMLIHSSNVWYSAVKRTPNASSLVYELFLMDKN